MVPGPRQASLLAWHRAWLKPPAEYAIRVDQAEPEAAKAGRLQVAAGDPAVGVCVPRPRSNYCATITPQPSRRHSFVSNDETPDSWRALQLASLYHQGPGCGGGRGRHAGNGPFSGQLRRAAQRRLTRV
jgi:hypothetical protein